MPKRLLAVNVVLGALCLLSVAFILQQLTVAPPPTPAGRARTASTTAAEADAGVPRPARPAGVYATIAARNLFSPTRTEDSAAGAASAASTAGKPTLYGVVLRDDSSIAYLEDPATKRTSGYRIGDAVAGGTVQTISADQVVLASPSGEVKVRLRDPSKPRAPVQPPPQPGAAVRPTVPTVPRAGATFQPSPPGAVPPPWTVPLPGFMPPALPGQTPSLPAPSVRPSPSVGRRVIIPGGPGVQRQ